jgi:hypothetical protein
LATSGLLEPIISNNCDDADDTLTEKMSFVGQANELLYNFGNVECATKTKLVNAYCFSFYGAEIWDLSHHDIESVCTAWRIKGLANMANSLRNSHGFIAALEQYLSG